MKRFWTRIIVCLVPTLLSLAVVAWAYNQYINGLGGFVPGVDLVGGTILVYEVDESKMTPEALQAFKIENLTDALKRRIDPTDLYNITIRPVRGTPPRVEIILPTGGQHQADIERRKWERILADATREFPLKGVEKPYEDVQKGEGARGGLVDAITNSIRPQVEAWVKETVNPEKGKRPAWKTVQSDAAAKYPVPGVSSPYADIADGDTATLVTRIVDTERRRINDWVEQKMGAASGGKRMLTGDEVEHIKSLVARQGKLEFRILANEFDDREAFAAARATLTRLKEELPRLEQKSEPPPAPRRDDGGATFPVGLPGEPDHQYSWVELSKDYIWGRGVGLNSQALERNPALRRQVEEATKTGQPFTMGTNLIFVRDITDWSRRSLKDRQQGKTREFFALVRDPVKGKEITGDYLVRVSQGSDQSGNRTIDFVFNAEGGDLFYDVTSRNKPTGDKESGFKRQLAIIFDAQISSAPNLISPIRTNGQITGNFSQQDIDESLQILRAGALPATLKKDPVSENSKGATLGADTVFWGFWSVVGAFIAVLLFMIFYYRFAGLVACVALFANLLLTVACMVLLQAAFTLPGLAGLVLMLGMAVDANVLIYERLREERERGASLALALRNGYDRAFPTILDTHLTSIFTAIVLYVVGNDQLKGFGVSLFIGLIISLFTSLYMTRTIFEIWLAKGWLKELNFFNGLVKLIHSRYWDFMSIRHYWFTATIILTILGAALFIYRADSDPRSGKTTVLAIDFTGGTAFTGQLARPSDLKALRKALIEDVEPQNRLPDLSIEQIFVSGDKSAEPGKSRFFAVSTSEKDSTKVLSFISTQLRDEPQLKMLKIGSFGIETSAAGAVGARLAFVNESGKEADFASPAQVQRVVVREMVDRGRSPSSFSIDRPGKRELKWDDVQAAATAAFPVAAKDKPYAEIAGDKRDALADAIFTQSVRPRIEAWLKDNAAAGKDESKWKGVLSDAAKLYAGPPDAFAKITTGDTGALRAAVEKAARDNVTAWVNAAVTGTVEQEGRYSVLSLKLNDPLPAAELASVLRAVQDKFNQSPQPERLEVFDTQLASSTQERAMYAILASWAAILLYLWFRFGNWTFGAAAVCCLIHDLLFTLGIVAGCHYIHALFGSYFLGIQDFKIDLAAVAALLTLVGYSVNDTIVVFDRIREVRGKNPFLTPQMINDSVNQTLTRTILASTTVMCVVLVLYIMGGEGVKLFAFVMIVGVIIGTYSSIYIASPLLLIFGEGRSTSPAALDRAPAEVERG